MHLLIKEINSFNSNDCNEKIIGQGWSKYGDFPVDSRLQKLFAEAKG